MTPGEIQQVLDTLSTVARYGTDSAVCVKASLCIQALRATLAEQDAEIAKLRLGLQTITEDRDYKANTIGHLKAEFGRVAPDSKEED